MTRSKRAAPRSGTIPHDAELLATAIAQAGEAVVITDATGAIQYVNPAFERISGFSRHEALGRNPRIQKSGHQDEAFYREMWRTLTAGETWRGRLVNRRKDGSTYTEEVSISPVLDATDTVASYVAVKRDITHEQSLEAQLRQAQKMEAVGHLAGGVAHDFNNLLTAILGYGELLLSSHSDDLVVCEEIGQILGAARRAERLTRQLLAFSRKQVLLPEPLSLNLVLMELEGLLERILGEDIALVLDLDPDLDAVVADRGQIEQVILNLAANSRDAMPGGGTLTLRTASRSVDQEAVRCKPGLRPGEYVSLSAEDTGEGIEPGIQQRVFEPFFTTKPPGKGSGLGLSTVFGIVKQSGGYLDLESTPGKGATFTVLLPRSDRALAPIVSKPMKPLAPPSGKMTILVVEDDGMTRDLIRRVLEQGGYQVLVAEGGEQAMELCRSRQKPPDLLLSDVVMPKHSGPEVARMLRRRYPQLPMLLMSGYSGGRLAEHVPQQQQVDLLQKPFSVADLTRAVASALAARSNGRA
jgi:PAS domain S-box-containing protein